MLNSGTTNSRTCITPALGDMTKLNQPLDIMMLIEGISIEYAPIGVSFTYRNDPVLTQIYPLATILA